MFLYWLDQIQSSYINSCNYSVFLLIIQNMKQMDVKPPRPLRCDVMKYSVTSGDVSRWGVSLFDLCGLYDPQNFSFSLCGLLSILPEISNDMLHTTHAFSLYSIKTMTLKYVVKEYWMNVSYRSHMTGVSGSI